MSFIGDIWKNVKLNTGKVAHNAASSVSWAYTHSPAQEIIYKNNRAYKSVFTHVAKQMAASEIEGQINKLFPRYQKYLAEIERKNVLPEQKSNDKLLIENQQNQTESDGCITTVEGRQIIAKDKYGNKIPEALMLYYEGDEMIKVWDTKETSTEYEEIHVHDGTRKIKYNVTKPDNFSTRTVCFIDLNPDVSVQSSKNIVMTTVQGRDYTRKELVSGGDLTFSVTGEIVGNKIGEYPENDVRKFIQMMQYGGVVKVNHFLFRQFNIKQILIKDFNLSTQEFKNVQPYSFTCVAVEPDKDVVITTDTIAVVNEKIKLSPLKSWYKFVLNNKYAEITANAASSVLSSSINGGLDALTKNI